MSPRPAVPAALAGLQRKRRLALAALWVEQVWPAVWPGLGVLGVYAGVALLDVPASLPAWPRAALPVVAVAGAAGLLWRGLRRMERPTAAMADRRLERDGGVPHRPLAALADRPADPTPEQEALWRVHLQRLAAAVPRLAVRQPRPGLARRDRFALRGAVVVFLVAAAVVAGGDGPARLWRGFVPRLPEVPAGPGTQVQAWITPPAYTGLPPVVVPQAVAEGEPAARVPTGSRITVSVSGGKDGEPSLLLDGAATAFHALDATSWQVEGDLGAGHDGAVQAEVRRNGTLARWTFRLIADRPPVPLFTEAPGPAGAEGRPAQQTRFPWQVSDDYGVASLKVELRLVGRPTAAPVVVAVPLSGAPKSARGALAPDLTAHPWAGLPVLARLVATDAPGQTGQSADAELTLPAREFHNPAARALIAVRRQLSLQPDQRQVARAVVDGIADDPASVNNATGMLLNLRALAALLGRGRGAEAVDEAQARMWSLALALEEDAPERTAQALQQALQAMRDAMDPNRPDKPPPGEMERRAQELREAIQRHMEALAEQAQRDGTAMPLDPDMPHMTAADLDRLAQKLQDALQQNRTADAQQQMAELEKLLDALKNATPQSREDRERQRAERRQRGRDQMDVVGDMVQREGKLLDQSEKRAAEGNNNGANGPRPGQAPSPAPSSSPAPAPSAQQRAADAKAQAAMRRALGELMQRFGDLTGEIPAPLGEADQAMRDAAQALADGRETAANSATRRAIEALQKGSQQMGQQMARQFGTGQQPGEGEGEGEEGEGDGTGTGQAFGGTRNGDGRTAGPRPGQSPGSGQRRSVNRDPLGRPLQQGTSGSSESGDVAIPDDMEQARTRQLQDELRRRGADRTRRQDELDYIDRLLNPF